MEGGGVVVDEMESEEGVGALEVRSGVGSERERMDETHWSNSDGDEALA